MLKGIERRSRALTELADRIWEFAEPAFREVRSAEALAEYLRGEGFKVTMGVADIPSAFVAEYGTSGPVVGFLGEYDALPGLSQKICVEKAPAIPGGAGHGCGHNLLGVGSLGGALLVKDAIESGAVKGRVKYFGCPAEELVAGKVFMVRAGCFDGLDCALTWHPLSVNGVWGTACTAMNSAKFHFHGRTAHAAADPFNGRSALDAVEIMNVAVNFLREHVIPDVRIHYVITNGGGEPNVVPAEATVWYYVRAPRRFQVEETYERVIKCAEGAALATGTTMEIEFLNGCYNVLSNPVLERVLAEKFAEVGPPAFTEEDQVFARGILETIPDRYENGKKDLMEKYGIDVGDKILCDFIVPQVIDGGKPTPGSTDVGDVSYVVPTSQIETAGGPIGATTHSWQYTATVGMHIGHESMLVAAQVLGLAGVEMLKRPGLLSEAKAAFIKQRGDEVYVSPLPEGTKPRLDLVH
ncbi:MAG: amidohydrolase [Synergistaceae bacterium]|jgi:aminobenzoyl-glutamate utilization protein B|nr:amidohydrolase [Synergistaceae bacterium]